MRVPTVALLAGLLAGPPLAARAAPAAKPSKAAAAPASKAAPKAAPAPSPKAAPTPAPAAAQPAAAAAKPAPKPMTMHAVPIGTTHHTVLANLHYRLKNGLQVILYEDPRQPRVRVSIWYHSGSCNEHPGLHGMAHLFEHLMFEGSAHMGQSVLADTAQRAPGDGQAGPGVRGARPVQSGDSVDLTFNVFEYLQFAGATGVDAETSYEHTRFFETVPPENLRVALWLESDRMGFLDAFKKKKLNKQRHIVDNELRQRIKTVPYASADIQMWHALWPKTHPCHDSPAGSIKDLTHVTLKDMRDYYDPAYAPADATLVLAGDLPKNTKKMVAKYFGTLPARKPMPRIHYKPVHLTHQVVLNTTDRLAKTPEVVLAWHAPRILTQGDAVADLTTELLTGSPQARLEHALRKQHLVAEVEADLEEHGFGSVFAIRAIPRPGVAPKTVIAAIDKVLASLRAPVSADELARARVRLETERLVGLQGLTAKAALLQEYAQFGHDNDPDGFYADLSRYERVTPTDVAHFVKTALAPNERVRLVVMPGAKGASKGAAKPASKPAAKPVAKAATKPVAKAASKPVAKEGR